MLDARPRADRARRRRLRLHAERAHARARRGGALRQPVARARVQAGRVPRAVRAPLRATSTCSACSTRASCARTRSRSSASAGTACTRRLHVTQPVLRALHARDQRARLHAAPRRPGAQPRPARGAAPMKRVSIVLHTHMPYVEGFGTWPFGEEWLWEAIATSYLPLLDVLDAHPGKVTLSHHARCSPTSSRRRARSSAAWRSCATSGPPAHALDAVDHPERRRRSRTRPRSTSRAADALERRGDLIAAFAPARHLDVAPPPTPCCRCWPPTPACACSWRPGSRRTGAASAPGTAASGCPSARTRRGSTSCSRRRACTSRAWTGPTSAITRAEPDRGRDRPRPARPRRRSTASGTRAATRRTATTATRTGSRPRAHQAWANDGEPYDPERGHARARAHARGVRRRRHRRPAVVAFDTELFGHHWHEGVTFLERVLELADVVPVAIDRRRYAAPADVPPTSWGTGRDLRTWSRRRASRGPSAARSSPRWARPPARARCASCSRCRAPTGRSRSTNATAGEYPRERAEGHHAAFEAALARSKADEALRHLAPELATWAFVQP